MEWENLELQIGPLSATPTALRQLKACLWWKKMKIQQWIWVNDGQWAFNCNTILTCLCTRTRDLMLTIVPKLSSMSFHWGEPPFFAWLSEFMARLWSHPLQSWRQRWGYCWRHIIGITEAFNGFLVGISRRFRFQSTKRTIGGLTQVLSCQLMQKSPQKSFCRWPIPKQKSKSPVHSQHHAVPAVVALPLAAPTCPKKLGVGRHEIPRRRWCHGWKDKIWLNLFFGWFFRLQYFFTWFFLFSKWLKQLKQIKAWISLNLLHFCRYSSLWDYFWCHKMTNSLKKFHDFSFLVTSSSTDRLLFCATAWLSRRTDPWGRIRPLWILGSIQSLPKLQWYQ